MASDSALIVTSSNKYLLGILQSRVHNVWLRSVGGRLEGRLRYSGGVVYNTFVWPDVDEKQREKIARCAQAVLDARKVYPDATIAQLYDPDNSWLYPELTQAHEDLDRAVEEAYGFRGTPEEKDIAERLFELYEAAIEAEASS